MVNEMRENVIKNKCFEFGIRIVKLYQFCHINHLIDYKTHQNNQNQL